MCILWQKIKFRWHIYKIFFKFKQFIANITRICKVRKLFILLKSLCLWCIVLCSRLLSSLVVTIPPWKIRMIYPSRVISIWIRIVLQLRIIININYLICSGRLSKGITLLAIYTIMITITVHPIIIIIWNIWNISNMWRPISINKLKCL